MFFSPKMVIFDLKTGFLTKIPVYGGSKKPKKITKNDDEVSGFLTIFWSKSQYMGPLQTPKIVKIHENPRFRPAGHPPPKIIKNRLNFAHSKICEKSRFLPNFDVKIKPPL